jgi:hypothetical protein
MKSRLGGPHSRSGYYREEINILPMPGNVPWLQDCSGRRLVILLRRTKSLVMLIVTQVQVLPTVFNAGAQFQFCVRIRTYRSHNTCCFNLLRSLSNSSHKTILPQQTNITLYRVLITVALFRRLSRSTSQIISECTLFSMWSPPSTPARLGFWKRTHNRSISSFQHPNNFSIKNSPIKNHLV